MEKDEIVEQMKSSDLDVDIGDGIIQHLKFVPIKDFYDGDEKFFGIKIKQQGRRLIIILKIYNEKRRNEIISNSSMVIRMLLKIDTKIGNEVDSIHLVDSIDLLKQLSQYKIQSGSFLKERSQKIDVTIELMDLITGEMVPVEFSLRLMNVENNKVFIGKEKS